MTNPNDLLGERLRPPASVEPSSPAEIPRQDQGGLQDAETARVISKVRRLMLVSSILTALAIGGVFAAIGYRVFTREERVQIPDRATLTLPRDAKILQTTVASDRIVLVIEAGGTTEIRTYDLRTLKPMGQLTLSRSP
jgi:hypothetical protein